MIDDRDLLERGLEGLEPDPGLTERVLRRRERKQRNQRISAGVVGAAVALGVALVGARAIDSAPEPGPAVESPVVPGTPQDQGDLYGVDPATGATTVLLEARGLQDDPEVSPEGSQIVYEGPDAAGETQIFVLLTDGRSEQITAIEGGAHDPAWSPNGEQIAFSAPGPGEADTDDIFLMNADGTRARRLAGTPEQDAAPDWSPDGAQIVFESGVNVGNGRRTALWLADVADGNLTQLRGSAGEPAWSPDGRWIAYTTIAVGTINGRFAFAEVHVIRPDGTSERRLVDYPARLGEYGHFFLTPSWSPDSGSIVVEDRAPASRSYWDGRSLRIIDVSTGRLRTILDIGGVPSETKLHDRVGAVILAHPSWGAQGIVVSMPPMSDQGE